MPVYEYRGQRVNIADDDTEYRGYFEAPVAGTKEQFGCVVGDEARLAAGSLDAMVEEVEEQLAFSQRFELDAGSNARGERRVTLHP